MRFQHGCYLAMGLLLSTMTTTVWATAMPQLPEEVDDKPLGSGPPSDRPLPPGAKENLREDRTAQGRQLLNDCAINYINKRLPADEAKLRSSIIWCRSVISYVGDLNQENILEGRQQLRLYFGLPTPEGDDPLDVGYFREWTF